MARSHQPPSVGRIVHFFESGPGLEPTRRAALVTAVERHPDNFGLHGSLLDLAIFRPTGQEFRRSIPYGPGLEGHWAWPPVVPPVVEPEPELLIVDEPAEPVELPNGYEWALPHLDAPGGPLWMPGSRDLKP